MQLQGIQTSRTRLCRALSMPFDALLQLMRSGNSSIPIIKYNVIQYGDKTNYRCPFCGALLLKSEITGPGACSKCCAKGKVDLSNAFYKLQKPHLFATQRSAEDEQQHNQLPNDAAKQLDELFARMQNRLRRGLDDPVANKFYNQSMLYNNEFACGCATTHQEASRPGGYQPVKMNGQITFRVSGIRPPDQRSALFGQVWTLEPQEAVASRIERNMNRRPRLNVNLLSISSVFDFSFTE